ncbi:hypothetical protein E4K10_48830 [Streptomyces sp. T1317-0309]|nr:hypothetical protein E4K10_48830 [Streptomyces sp. T1317-0309]
MIRDDTCDEARRREMVAAVEAQRRRADEIAEFSSALITASTEQELRQVVLTRLAATFAGTGAALALVDDEEHLSVSSDAGLPSWHVDALHCRSLDEQGPLPHAIRTGEPLFIRNQEDLLRRWPNGDAAPLAWPGPDVAMSITPLGLGGAQAPGAWVVTYDSGHHPSPDEKAFMITLAELAGQALGRIRSQQARLELATAVQDHMLPKLPENLPGLEVAARYRPCRAGLDIGGDWYDAFLMTDGAIAVEIGDAQGHDVDAAAFRDRCAAPCERSPRTSRTPRVCSHTPISCSSRWARPGSPAAPCCASIPTADGSPGRTPAMCPCLPRIRTAVTRSTRCRAVPSWESCRTPTTGGDLHPRQGHRAGHGHRRRGRRAGSLTGRRTGAHRNTGRPGRPRRTERRRNR